MINRYSHFISSYKQYQATILPALKTTKARAYTTLILSFFTMAFFAFFAIRPTLRIIARLYREINDSRIIDERLSQKIENLAAAQADYGLISGAIPLLSRALPSTADLAQFLSTIEKLERASEATVSALTVDAVKISTPSAESFANGPVEIPFSFSVKGSYDQVVNYLKFLVTNPRLIRIDSLNFASAGEGALILTVDAKAKGFYYQAKVDSKQKPAPQQSGQEKQTIDEDENLGK